MKKFLREIASLLLIGAVTLFASCKIDGVGYDYIGDSEATSPEVSVSGLTAGTSTDYVLDLTDSLPGEAEGSFTIFVKNVKPGKINISSKSSALTFSKGSIEATTAEDSVGEGAWKCVVSYKADEDADVETSTMQIVVMFSTLDPVTKTVATSLSYMQENEAVAVTGFNTPSQSENTASEHSFTLTWTAGDYTSITYRLYQVIEGDDPSTAAVETSYEKFIEEGELPGTATSLIPKANLEAVSEFKVKFVSVTKKRMGNFNSNRNSHNRRYYSSRYTCCSKEG